MSKRFTFQETMGLMDDYKVEFYNNLIAENERKLNESMEKDELVQYFIVNSELNMSAGKIAAQVAHVATSIASNLSWREDYRDVRATGISQDEDYIKHEAACDKFDMWLENSQPKIILRGKQKDMEKLIEQGWYYIRDNGRTEIPADSLTVIGFVPEYKSIMKPIVKRFQLL